MVIRYRTFSEIVKDLEIFGEISLYGEDLYNLSSREINKLNKLILYGKIDAWISFDFGDVYDYGEEIREIRKTRSGKILLFLWLHENWEDAEWLVKRLRETGVRARLDKDSEKAIVIMELPKNMYIHIAKSDEFY